MNSQYSAPSSYPNNPTHPIDDASPQPLLSGAVSLKDAKTADVSRNPSSEVPATDCCSSGTSLKASGLNECVTTKRTNNINWDDYFMSIAFLSAMRSKDPSTQVGACIVSPDKRIVGIGYNGFPQGCSDDDLPWARVADNPLDTKYPVRAFLSFVSLFCV